MTLEAFFLGLSLALSWVLFVYCGFWLLGRQINRDTKRRLAEAAAKVQDRDNARRRIDCELHDTQDHHQGPARPGPHPSRGGGDVLRPVEQAQREQQILDIAIKVKAGDPSHVGHYNQRKKEIQLDEPYLAAKIKAAFEIAEDILDHHLQRKSNALYDSDLGFLSCYQREQEEAIARRDEQNATPGSIESRSEQASRR